MLGLVAATELGVARHAQDFTRDAILSWAMSAQAVQHAAPAAEILCFGDSSTAAGKACWLMCPGWWPNTLLL